MVMITITMKKLEKMSKLVMVVRGMKIGRNCCGGDAEADTEEAEYDSR
jgi:hypothetical protein